MTLKQLIQVELIWTFSNILSFLRLIIGFFIYAFILKRNTALALILSLIAVLSDYADGYFARKRNEISELGKILDPLADKVAVALAVLALYQSYGLPLWIVVGIIGRDIFILFGASILMGRIKKVTASEIPGKIAVTIISSLILVYILELHSLKQFFIILTLIAIVFSFLFYLFKFIQIFQHSISEPEK
jgi:CDP-diacylglycerol--glycerol-3-phosphate 3-phosphatidyltransferase